MITKPGIRVIETDRYPGGKQAAQHTKKEYISTVYLSCYIGINTWYSYQQSDWGLYSSWLSLHAKYNFDLDCEQRWNISFEMLLTFPVRLHLRIYWEITNIQRNLPTQHVNLSAQTSYLSANWNIRLRHLASELETFYLNCRRNNSKKFFFLQTGSQKVVWLDIKYLSESIRYLGIIIPPSL